MFKNTKNDYIGWLVLIGVVILLLEILFFNQWAYFLSFYLWRHDLFRPKRAGKKIGKFLFIGGIIFFVLSIFNMMTFKFLLLAILLHFFIQFSNAKKNPKKIIT